MKKIAFALFLAGICAAPSMASAEMKPYVSVSAGLGTLSDIKTGFELHEVQWESGPSTFECNSGLALEGAVGLKMDMFRGELAVGYQSNDLDKLTVDTIEKRAVLADQNATVGVDGEVSILSYMLNAYADINVGGGITPYLMAGAGIANVDVDATITASGDQGTTTEPIKSEDSVFAWQVGAGVSVPVAEKIDMSLEYRYFVTGEIEDTDIDFKSSKILLGMRYSF